jgi:hypothetical protein
MGPHVHGNSIGLSLQSLAYEKSRETSALLDEDRLFQSRQAAATNREMPYNSQFGF